MTWRILPPAAFSSLPGLKIFSERLRRIAFDSRMSRTFLSVSELSVRMVMLSLLCTISVLVSFKSYRVCTSRRVWSRALTNSCSSNCETISNEQSPAIEFLSRSEEHTSELQSRQYLVCRLLLEKKKEK